MLHKIRIHSDDILDFPLLTFCSVPTYIRNNQYLRLVYLINSPVINMTPTLSDTSIPIGQKGSIYFLNVLSYNLGYVFDVPISQTLHKSTYIIIGGEISSTFKQVGDISTSYYDQNILVLHNKKHGSYIITSANNIDIPQPIDLSLIIN